MAFLRKEKKETSTYLRIVQSYRSEASKSRHKTLYNLGKAKNYSACVLKKQEFAVIDMAVKVKKNVESSVILRKKE